ncbi:MAG TPA: DUF1801 domain-containing protein [Rubrobacteraceae bacterium]|nr:DUF1801 domain-containing protein [Rubrobacteraceae bacterium]
MADTTHDPRVDAYVESLPGWQQDICRKVRTLVHAADPEVTETIKRTDRPYFVLRGNVCALLAAKDHVNVFLYDPLVPDPAGIITSGHENKSGRTVAIHRGRRSTERRSSPCFGPSLRITGPEAGVRSCASSDPLEPSIRTLVALIRRQVTEVDGQSCKGGEGDTQVKQLRPLKTPLFTRVRRRGVLGSSHLRCCIAPPLSTLALEEPGSE